MVVKRRRARRVDRHHPAAQRVQVADQRLEFVLLGRNARQPGGDRVRQRPLRGVANLVLVVDDRDQLVEIATRQRLGRVYVPAGAQHPPCFAQRRQHLRDRHMMQRRPEHDQIEAGVVQRDRLGASDEIPGARPVVGGPGRRQLLIGDLDPGDARAERGQLAHKPAMAAADIEHVLAGGLDVSSQQVDVGRRHRVALYG